MTEDEQKLGKTGRMLSRALAAHRAGQSVLVVAQHQADVERLRERLRYLGANAEEQACVRVVSLGNAYPNMLGRVVDDLYFDGATFDCKGVLDVWDLCAPRAKRAHS